MGALIPRAPLAEELLDCFLYAAVAVYFREAAMKLGTRY